MSNYRRIILVTGGAGFIGSNLIEALSSSGQDQIISLDNDSNATSEEERVYASNIVYRKGHTKDIDNIIHETPNLVFHLGEYARIAPSYNEIPKVFDYNIAGTVAVLEFCRHRRVSKFIYTASSTKFALSTSAGEKGGEKDCEGRNQSPYAFTKAMNVDLIKNYSAWFGLKYAIAYFFSVYGPREKGVGEYATVIAKFKKLYLENKPLTVVKPGTQVRGFTHVKDTVDGLLLVSEKGEGDGYEIGSGQDYTINDVANMFGPPIDLKEGDPGRMGNRKIDLTKMTNLGWRPTTRLEDHIKEFLLSNPRA